MEKIGGTLYESLAKQAMADVRMVYRRARARPDNESCDRLAQLLDKQHLELETFIEQERKTIARRTAQLAEQARKEEGRKAREAARLAKKNKKPSRGSVEAL